MVPVTLNTHIIFSLWCLLNDYYCSWEVLQNLGSDYLPILLSIPLSLVFCPNECPLPSIFQKLAGMTLPPTLSLTVLLQRNTFFFPLPLLSLPIWQLMRPNLPFLSVTSNTILKLGGLLRWKKQVVKDANFCCRSQK